MDCHNILLQALEYKAPGEKEAARMVMTADSKTIEFTRFLNFKLFKCQCMACNYMQRENHEGAELVATVAQR